MNNHCCRKNVGVAVSLIGCMAAWSTPVHAQQAANGKFPSASVAGVPVAGLTYEEALRRTRRELDKKLETQIALTSGSRTVRRKRRDLGVELELGWMLGRAQSGQKYVPLRLRSNIPKTQVAMRRLA